MSRRVVVIILVVLIVGVVGGTAALIASRLRPQQEQPGDTTGQGSLGEAPIGRQNIVDPTGDDDNDGLSNSDEVLWGTSRTNPDTDGDGYLDGEEVAAGHNPTIPAPNDKLPPGFTPGREQNPLDTAPAQPVAVDQFFADNLDLDPVGPNRNITNEYNARFSQNERTSTTVREFITEQPIVTQLPRPNEQSVRVGTDNSSDAIAAYLQVAGDLSSFNNKYLLGDVINSMLSGGNSSSALSFAYQIQLHQEELLQLTVPPAAENLHQLLLGYTELLKTTFEQMARWDQDELRGLLALRQLEAIDAQYYPLIQQEIVRLAASAL